MDGVEPLVARARGPLGRRVRLRMLVALIPLVVLAAAPIPALEPSAERPAYSVGEQWLLKDGVYELTKIEKNRYVWASSAGRQIHLTKDLALVSVLKDRIWEWDVTPVPEIAWPLEVGKWGLMHRATLRMRSQPSGIPVRLSWQVKVYEDVRVVGGLFKAFQIVYAANVDTGDPFRGGLQVPGAQSWQVTAWYAPEVRRIVKIQSTSIDALNFEVISLEHPPTVAAPAPPPAAVVPATPPPAAVPAGPAGPVARPPAPPPAAPAVPGSSPLQVTISSPKDQQQVSQPTLALAAVASGGKGVSRVVVTLNGVVVARLEERAPQRAMPVNVALKLEEGQNVVVVTAIDADGITQQEMRAVVYDKVTPLAIQFRHPEERARVTDEASVAAAVATSSQGVIEVNVILNGTQVFQQRERSPKKSIAIAAPIKLREGANSIVVRATSADGLVQQEVRTVTYERSTAPPEGPTPPRLGTSRDRWAVVIGVGRYASPDIPSLRYSVADAEAFAQLLIERGGFKKENVLLLTEKSERKPTLRDMKWALGTFLARSAKKEDLVVIFYAGHGAPEIDPRGSEPDGLAKYLVPSDADPNDLYATALPMDELQIIFDRIEAERVVVFLDACYSGAAGGRTFASKRTRALRVDDVFLDRLARSRGRAIITASRASEVSLELPELGHGLFTHYLLQGLRGTADLDRDGVVTLQELYTYLEQQVTQKSRGVGGNQHPVMKGEMEGQLPLVKVGGR
jgi:hypothetical protein